MEQKFTILAKPNPNAYSLTKEQLKELENQKANMKQKTRNTKTLEKIKQIISTPKEDELSK